MVDVFIRDEDVTFKDEDVTFDHHVLTLTVADAYSACAVGSVLLEYAFLISHGIQTNVVAAVVLVQEHNPVVANTAHSSLPQSITLNIDSADEPDPVWFDTETAIFKDHGDGVFYPHYSTLLEFSNGTQANVTETVLLFIESVLSVGAASNKSVADAVILSEEVSGISFAPADTYSQTTSDTLTLIQTNSIKLWSDSIEIYSPADSVFSEKTNNTFWEADAYPDLDAPWEPVLDEDIGYSQQLERVGLWAIGYRPNQLKVTFTGASRISIGLYTDSYANIGTFNGYDVASGRSLSIANYIGDIKYISFGNVSYKDQPYFEITKIEFGFFDTVDLDVEYVVTVADGIQKNVTETVALIIEGVDNVIFSDTVQSQYADTIGLYQEYALAVSDSSIVNAADSVLFTGAGVLVVQNAYNAQTASAVTVSEHNTLVVSNAIDAQLSDSAVLGQTYYITASDAYNAQVAESPLLNVESEDVLTVANIAHSQLVDALVLIQSHVANTLDCAQLQYTDTLDLLISHALAVGSCENKNFAQAVVLEFKSGFLGVVVDPYLISLTQNRAMESVTPHRYLMQ